VPRILEIAPVSPREYELAVRRMLDGAGVVLEEYQSAHLETVEAADGTYAIDVTARFKALGASFLVLIECKHQARKTERQEVQVLHAKLQSVGAQKAMLFSVSGFQEGAIEYADAHGISLVHFAAGHTAWHTKSAGPPTPPPPWAGVPEYVGWWCQGNRMTLVSERDPLYMRQALGLEAGDPRT
jgi:restriction system protein